MVGENLQYLVQTRDGQDVACLLFGAAAWQCAARDTFIGWTAAQRAEGLSAVVNNTRSPYFALGKGAGFSESCPEPGGAAAKWRLATQI